MKILFLLTQDLESPSGLGRYWPLAKELVRLGHRVTILALHHNFQALERRCFIREGVKVHYVGQMHVIKRDNRKFYFSPIRLMWISALATWRLLRCALRTPADVYHIGKPHPMNSVAGLITAYARRKCVFLDCDDYEAASNRFGGAWQKWIVAWFENVIPRHVHHITTHNCFLRNRLLALGIPPERITYLPNGVDAERFSRCDFAQVDFLRSKFGLTGKKVVAFIGSLSSPSHPVDLVLDAFVRVQRIQPESTLLIVGGGEDYERLQGRIQEMGLSGQVLICGQVPDTEVPMYYRLADVVVEPVYDDDAGRARLPLKLFESWISGVPFVTADVGDRRMILGSPPAGVLVRPGDPDALSDGIIHILLNPAEAATLRERGLERVKGFRWDHLARLMEATYYMYTASQAHS